MIDIKVLKSVAVFANLTKDELNTLAQICQVRKTKKGEKIFKSGDARKTFYVIVSGILRIYRKFKNEEQTLTILDKNNFAVESALVNPKLRHTHYGEILEEGEIIEMDGKDFLALTQKTPDLGNRIYGNIVTNLTERLHHANNKLITLYATGQIASTYTDIYNLLPLLLETILTVIKAKKAFFALFDPFNNKIIVQEAIGYANNQRVKNLSLNLRNDPFLGKIYESSADIFVREEDLKRDHKLKELSYLVKNALGVKIRVGLKNIGAIVLSEKKHEDFNFNNQILLNIISKQVALAVQEAEKSTDKELHEELGREYIKPI